MIGIYTIKYSMPFAKSHLVALWSVPGIGVDSFKRCLLAQKKSELNDEEFWVNGGGVWQNAALSEKQILSIEKFKKEHNYLDLYQQLKALGIRVLLEREASYPLLLKKIEQAPPVLFVKSKQAISAATWQGLFLAVVGTRRITSYGHLVIRRLLRDIVQTSQAKVVSGFMYGVDVAAMQLAHQLTQTIGVLGYGFNYCFPRSQQALLDKMLVEGAIFITTYPPATAPTKGSFVERNRLIAGLAQATLVIEAAERSGSLITANFALEMNRPVLTVPGPITNPFSVGCHQLIQSGAGLVAQLADFYHLLELEQSSQAQLPTAPPSVANHLTLTALEQQLIAILQARGGQLNMEELLSAGGTTAATILNSLLNLELKQLIVKRGQNYALKS